MNVDRLVAMANEIAAFFEADPDRTAAVAGVTNHLTRFWEPRMKKQIIEHQAAGGHGLTAVAAAAVAQLAERYGAASPSGTLPG